MKNPVMLTVYISAILTLILFVLSLFGISDSNPGFTLAISAILWLTVLFANFAEAIAEGRGKAQADSLRAASAMWTRISLPRRCWRRRITRKIPRSLFARVPRRSRPPRLKRRTSSS